MAKLMSSNRVVQQKEKLNVKLSVLEKKERKTYEALAAVINFLNKGKKGKLAPCKSFSTFKKDIISAVGQLSVKRKLKTASAEPKFNVKHYERAIKCAADATYRDMAIQAANKDLNHEAIGELVEEFKKDCRQSTRSVKELRAELRKSEKMNSVRRLLKNVVDPIVEDEDSLPVTG